MKITLLYLHVKAPGFKGAPPPEYYDTFHRRFARTYREYTPCIEHQLVVVGCGGPMTQPDMEIYAGLGATSAVYLGGGKDLGAYQTMVSFRPDDEWVVCLASPVYFWRSGWLESLALAAATNGDRMYGPMASYENAPHIRTGCFMVRSGTFKEFPMDIDTPEKCITAESSGDNRTQISNWYGHIGKAPLMVTWEGVYRRNEWRAPANIFRRGDQSNCLVYDRYTDQYFAASYPDRLGLERSADGKA